MNTTTPPLKRALRWRDLLLLNIVAVYTPGTLAQTMPLGRFSLVVWALALLTFMLPYAAALADLTRLHPREGGVYAWTRLALGDRHGFLCGWCYWVNTFLYVPSVFLGMAAVAALLGGARTAWLNDNPLAVAWLACLALALAAGLHIVGLGQGKWLQNLGAIGRLALALALLLAAWWKWRAPQAVTIPASSLNAWQTMALWPFVLNALVGLDLGPAMSEESAAPQRDIPRALLVGGVAVAACYLLTCAAVLVLNVAEPSVIYGHVQAINSVLPAGAWLVVAVVLLDLLGLLGSGAAWLAAPARVPFAIGLDHYLPPAFARVHPRFGTPHVALLVQAGTAMALILANTYGAKKLQDAYLALLGASIVLVLVTYVYLFAAWWRLAQARTLRLRLLCLAGWLATLTALAACFMAPPAVADARGFVWQLGASVALMLGAGVALYGLAAWRTSAKLR